MTFHLTRRRQTHIQNSTIDRALLKMSIEHRQQVIRFTKVNSLIHLAERIRKRATLLAKHNRAKTESILKSRDELILYLYASAVPQGWSCGWSDGASINEGSHHHAGIGAIIMDSNGNIIERLSLDIGDQTAFVAELAAIAALMHTAIEHKQRQLLVYCDNNGIVQLWHEKREDERLNNIRRLSKQFTHFSLRSIPRLHNQAANALAKHAVKR